MAAGHGLERLTAWLRVPRLPHIRQLGLSIVASSLGFGVFIAATAVFLVRQVGLGAAQAGLVFSVANGFALLSALFLGSVVDRIGGGRAVLAAGGLAVMGFAAMTAVNDQLSAFLAVSLLAVATRLERISLGAVVAALYQGSDRVVVSGLFRSLTNLGFSLGSLAAAVAIAAGTRLSYGVVYGVAAVLQAPVIWLRRSILGAGNAVTPSGAHSRRLGAIRDVPYLVVSVLFGLATLHGIVLAVAMPLWIVQRTSLPASTAGALLLLNTVIVIVLQTRVASEVGSAGAASRLLIRSSVVAVLGFAAMLLSAGRFPVAVEAIAIVVGLLLVTLCELLSSAAAWTCRFDFAVDGRQGEYGALFGLGESAVSWVAPGILGLVLQLWGGAVWLLLGAVYLGIAVASPATVSWCARTRPAREVSQPLRAG